MSDYTFRVFMNVYAPTNEVTHVELGSYENLPAPPWVPPVGSFFRFRDHRPPNKEVNHAEKAGHVKDVVTCFYGTHTTVEIYLDLT